MISVELFSGAGGLALGLERAGFRHLALVEIEKYSCKTLRDNSRRGVLGVPEASIHEMDVADFDYAPPWPGSSPGSPPSGDRGFR